MNIEYWNCFRFNRIKQVFFKTINKRCQQKIFKTRQRFAPPHPCLSNHAKSTLKISPDSPLKRDEPLLVVVVEI
jgi:hypothetical protein